MSDLKVQVKEIKGCCPVHKLGDTFYILEGYKLETRRPICMHALASLMPYYVALSKGVLPEELGLGDSEKAYVQCLDPYEFTNGGTVIFCVYAEEQGSGSANGHRGAEEKDDSKP